MSSLLSITQLETHIDQLILTCQKLRQENLHLSEQLAQLRQEKLQLLAKNQQATTQIKQVIHQLREEIHE